MLLLIRLAKRTFRRYNEQARNLPDDKLITESRKFPSVNRFTQGRNESG